MINEDTDKEADKMPDNVAAGGAENREDQEVKDEEGNITFKKGEHPGGQAMIDKVQGDQSLKSNWSRRTIFAWRPKLG